MFTLSLSTLGMVLTQPGYGANWTRSFGITLAQTYTDNTDLDEDNTDSDLVTSITPGVAIRGEGGRLSLSFLYGFNFNYHTNSDSNTDINHRLQTTATSELARDWLFLDARATATQTLVDSFGASGDTVNDNDNRQNTFTWSVSPHTRHRFGSFADMTTRAEYNEVKNSTSEDSKGVNAGANLMSGRRFTKTPWSLVYLYVKDFDYNNERNGRADGENSEDSEFHVLNGFASYVLNRTWRINGSFGKEWNDFVSTDSGEVDGYRWAMGAGWTPNPRTSLSVAYNSRPFGNFWSFDFFHRSRRSVWTAGYSRDLGNARQLRLANDPFQTSDAFGNPINDPVTGDDLGINNELADSDDSIFVNEVFRSDYTLATGRSTAGLNVAHIRRKYLDSARNTKAFIIGLSLGRALSGVTNANVGLGWERYQDDSNPDEDEDREHDSWRASIGLNHTLSSRTNISLRYSYRNRSSDEEDDDYTENRIRLQLSTGWR